jgi:hypothetical protein
VVFPDRRTVEEASAALGLDFIAACSAIEAEVAKTHSTLPLHVAEHVRLDYDSGEKQFLWRRDSRDGAMQAGRVLVVQCGLGRNRSGLVIGCILAKLGFRDPLATLRAANPLALSGNRVFAEYVAGLAEKASATELRDFLHTLGAARRKS